MVENLGIALQITVIGMALVFGSIALLWGVMSALVRFASAPAPTEVQANEQEIARQLRRRAAAAAVAVALAQEDEWEPQLFPLPPTAHVSAWQAVRRSDQLKQRGSVR